MFGFLEGVLTNAKSWSPAEVETCLQDMKVAMSELDPKGTLALTAQVSKALDDVNLTSGGPVS